MPIIRKLLKASDVYPEDIRYDAETDTVQSLIGDEWVDNPDADPRRQTIYPVRTTSDTRCDAAKSIADAFKNQIDQVITAIGAAKTVFSIAGLILGLFTFGVFDIFVALALALANAMIAAGTGAIESALTDDAWNTFKCILRCHMDDDGRITPGSLAAIESDVSDQIGGLGATIINAMCQLAGEGGMNNLASLGTSTGDCSDCGCLDCAGDYAILSPYSDPDHGHITGRDGNIIHAVMGTLGYFIMTATDVTQCCFIDSVINISGGSVTSCCWQACGSGYGGEGAWVFTTPIGQCPALAQWQGTPGATFDIVIDICP